MNVDDHLSQAAHNAALNNYLDYDNSPFIDWSITATFYEALHYIDSYYVRVAGLGARPFKNHIERKNWMRKHLPLPIYTNYEMLESRSRNARYTTHYLTFTSTVERQHAKELRSKELELIKQYTTV